ncbi:deaminase [Spirillospora sp. NBC_01491]|uniref:deaminase n=1 Tax=Spirillospora sp. NBC_01491 TaxID=2976007 RepID=UPI002E34F229|nr:deaminase [Spirillospora sp. NBC_01491]
MDDLGWLDLACDLARLCPPSKTAFSVGAVIVGPDGREIARGFSRERDPRDHAEESALAKAPERVPGATVYSSLEPCDRRGSRPRGCAELIIAAGAARVVFAWREPSLFVEGTGAERLLAAGLEVVELPVLARRAREPNAHLVDRPERPDRPDLLDHPDRPDRPGPGG